MSRTSKFLSCSAIGVAILLGCSTAQAQNIVVNGGFEQGNPTPGVTPIGYSQYGNLGFTGISIGAAHSGMAAYDFGGSQLGGLGFLSQTLSTVAGQGYELSYYLLIPGGGPAEFLVNVGGDASSGALLGGKTLSDLIDPPTTEGSGPFPDNYKLMTAFFKADASSTNLIFGAYNNPSFFLLDDISVQPSSGAVPEPSAWALMLVGFGGVGALLRGSRLRYQRPRKTTLAASGAA